MTIDSHCRAWADWPYEPLQFQVQDVPKTSGCLLVEGEKDFDITLNAEAVSSEPVGWYLDRSFHKAALPTPCWRPRDLPAASIQV